MKCAKEEEHTKVQTLSDPYDQQPWHVLFCVRILDDGLPLARSRYTALLYTISLGVNHNSLVAV